MLRVNLTLSWREQNTQGLVATHTAVIRRLARGGRARPEINKLRVLSGSWSEEADLL